MVDLALIHLHCRRGGNEHAMALIEGYGAGGKPGAAGRTLKGKAGGVLRDIAGSELGGAGEASDTGSSLLHLAIF
jgi:hypothetical protein